MVFPPTAPGVLAAGGVMGVEVPPKVAVAPVLSDSPIGSDLRESLNHGTGRNNLAADGVQGGGSGSDGAPRHTGNLDLGSGVGGKEFLTGVEKAEVALRQASLPSEGDGAGGPGGLHVGGCSGLRACNTTTDLHADCHVIEDGGEVGVDQRN